MNSDYIGDINRWSLITPTFYLKDIDNKKLSKELLSNAKRKSNEQASTFYEDFVADHELNVVACMTEIMSQIKFK